jgi:predicted AAA+ superfamily ATPase
MPESWISRTLEDLVMAPPQALQLFPVWLVLGPRQVGKSALLRRCASHDRQLVDLDDLDVRTRAQQDPYLFSRDLRLPLLIDEIQYAPQLLSVVKRFADAGAPPGAVWLTGSQNFEVMTGVQETLAGRVAIIHLLGLSDEEKRLSVPGPAEYFVELCRSSFPRLFGVDDRAARELYLSSYTSTYIERDVRELLGIEKRREFEVFVKMCALRTGQIVNYQDLARDAGISPTTAKSWLGLLEDSFLIRLVHPYFKSRSKRLIKSPKLYFLDMGLAAHLAGWRDSEMLRLGPMGGAAFETNILGNILRHFLHRAREVEVYFWRTRDGEEIDFLVEAGGAVYPVEVKLGLPNPESIVSLTPIREGHWRGGSVISLAEIGSDSRKTVHPDWTVRGPQDLPFD